MVHNDHWDMEPQISGTAHANYELEEHSGLAETGLAQNKLNYLNCIVLH